MSHETLIFLHLPKTGGTTVRRALFRGLPGDRRIAVYPGRSVEPGELAEVPARSRAKAQVVAGHLSYGAHEAFEQPCRYVTVVRDPLRRVLSQFSAHVRRRERRGEQIDDLGIAFEGWITDPRRSGPDANGMTRRISGTEGPLRPRDVEVATRHIEGHFAAIATTNAIDAFLDAVAEIGGWKRPRRVVSRNVSDRKIEPGDLAPKHVERIETANALDRALYEWVVDRAGDGVHLPG